MRRIASVPADPRLARWMCFVDGENLTSQGTKRLVQAQFDLSPSNMFRPDEFLWLPHFTAREIVHQAGGTNLGPPLRSYYYTTYQGGDVARASLEKTIWDAGFEPRVYKRDRGHQTRKGLDISLAVDVLGNVFRGNCDVVLLIAGDGDYVPLLQEAKRQGTVVYVAFTEAGLSRDLALASDGTIALDESLLTQWTQHPNGHEVP